VAFLSEISHACIFFASWFPGAAVRFRSQQPCVFQSGVTQVDAQVEVQVCVPAVTTAPERVTPRR